MPASRLATFRCDASPAIGTGHVMRCLTLADFLAQLGWSCCFLCTNETPQTVPALKNSAYQLKRPDQAPEHAALLVVDHYGLDQTYEADCRKWVDKILVIDDLADRKHDCDILLDQTYRRDPVEYKNLVPGHCKILTGPAYALLRPQFSIARAPTLARRKACGGAIERVLVSLGGTNFCNITTTALKALQVFDQKPLTIDVVLGRNAPHIQLVKTQIEEIKKAGFHRVILHSDVQDMAALMRQADLSIGAGGTTSWERCCLGLPTLLIVLADNQKTIAKNLHKAGAVRTLGKMETLKPCDITHAIKKLQKQPAQLALIAEKSADICDGLGVKRIAPWLYPAIKTESGQSTRIRCMELEDAEIVLDWQSDPSTRKFFRNPNVPDRREHNQWVKRNIENVDCESYIIELDDSPAGLLRLDKKGNNTYEVSVLTAPQYYKRGVALTALRWARIFHPHNTLMAEILEENKVSKNLFTKAGYHRTSGNVYINKGTA